MISLEIGQELTIGLLPTQVIRPNMQFIVGYSFAPIAWLMGIAWEDAVLVGQLLGEKTILNEFYAYKTLGEMKAASLFAYEKSIVMATYIYVVLQFRIIGIKLEV